MKRLIIVGGAMCSLFLSTAAQAQSDWNFDAAACAADRMVATETGLRIELTNEMMLLGFMGPASAASGTEVGLSVWADGNSREATTEVGQLVDHDGVQWLEFSVPNDEPGGWPDRIANSRSISVAASTSSRGEGSDPFRGVIRVMLG